MQRRLTVITGKLMLGQNHGLVVGVGAGVGWVLAAALSIHADYVFHPNTILRSDYFAVSWYVGGGLWFSFSPAHLFARRGQGEVYSGYNYAAAIGFPWYGSSLGLRIPFGLDLALKTLPISVYVELVPALLVFPALGAGGGGAIGIRFYL